MTSSFDSAIQELLAQLRRQYESLARLQEAAAQVCGSATSARHQLTATVDSRGALTGIKFHGNAYRRMASEELANMIVETVRAAQRNARRSTFEQVGDLGISEATFDALADGSMDWRNASSDIFTIPQPLFDLLGTTPEELLAARGHSSLRTEQAPADGAGPRP